MSKYLLIVESPTKEKTISKFLGKDFVIKSSYGHIRDLPKSKLGIDLEDNFKPQYKNVKKAAKIISDLKARAKKAQKVYLATDYDREGEAIAWHLEEILDLPEEKVVRITFNEITSEAIKGAVAAPRKLDLNLVDSQQARRVLDRLVGYKLSPLLWKKIKRGLSAGRVQSVAVRLICDREDEIEKFNPQEYWSLEVELKKKAGEQRTFTAALVSKGGKKFDKLDLKEKALTDDIVKELEGAEYRVANLESKEKRRSPMPPYTTSTMQQDASRRINFSAAKTMMIAQSLYEGVEIGAEENVGLITYMRTDSLNIAESARKEAAKYVQEKHGQNFMPSKPRIYKTKSKGAQEAHEAIRPTSVYRTPEEVKKHLTSDQFKLYDLIWRRFVSSQMTDAVYDTLSADISAKDLLFRANGRLLKFSGFLEVYSVQENDDESKEKEGMLPPLQVKELLDLVNLIPEQHFTEPPPRYNEASLIKALEEDGIGRPSTYAPIIQTIQARNYVRLDQKRFLPTKLGRVVNDVLKKHFSEIVDLKFTATIEEKLDDVAEGKTPWTHVVGEFFEPFKKDLELAETNMPYQKIEPEKTNEVCPKCGMPLVIRESRRGRFMACSGFPKCRTTFSLDKNGQKIVRPAPEMTDEVCQKCGRPMLKRIGKRGPFLACSGFPKCRNIRKYMDKSNPDAGADKKPEKPA